MIKHTPQAVAGRDIAWREFHVARQARDRYEFEQTFFATNGNVIFANFQAARLFAQRMNDKRDVARFPEQAVQAGQLNALGLIDEILHYMIARYREQQNPQVLADALTWLETELGAAAVDATLRQFVTEFPPVAVYQGAQNTDDYLHGSTAGVANRQLALEELLLLWINNENPAAQPFAELLDDNALETHSPYLPVVNELHAFFATQPTFGPDDQNLIDMLRAPALAVPDSLLDQLRYLLQHWSAFAEPFFRRLLTSLDFIQEEQKPVFFGPGPSIVPAYERRGSGVGLDEPERFSPDKDWMPRAVLMAKNTYVWLDQLSRKYSRSIRRLDQIPDEELDTLARQGFTGLWLIGLWERSTASQRIKQMCGNPDAVASAYSLYDYDIAADLGGPDAMHELRVRAGERGLRMASDMVPNHMAIDSRWVMEHPDWFISLPNPPFPTYTFNGVDLSRDGRVGIYLEDHYYSRSDAAVVFKRVDKWTGSEQYVYHGNDGTSMPWNDTAQLNYLNPTVREAVIQTILHVARQFPIIRFDAAMTLAKRHYQRLWFPEPGTGGAIPSRAEYGLDTDQFNAAFPEEFWREVVDRVAQELPDTLLLAEAFWMMEGYFVRTLGMHRVYNSAFMNMLRDEENLKYRTVLKNTLEFEPDILKRFVNFMNNPDEKTAVEQFGKGDKYFGICAMMATLPGLPMFGHGQIEGFGEKYGMEYQRAYWDEQVDPYLVERHEREIFPLLKRRHIFAEAQDFLLYDFWAAEGSVNENVFAYSNRSGDERALVVYHNQYAEASGWIRSSVGALVKSDDGTKQVVQQTLGDGLGLTHGAGRFTIFRDNVSRLEYIRHSSELIEQGLYVALKAYELHVFLDFREVLDNAAGQYAQIAAQLNGRGVPSIEIALLEIELHPILEPFSDLVSADFFRRFAAQAQPTELESSAAPALPQEAATAEALLAEAETKALALLHAIASFNAPPAGAAPSTAPASEQADAETVAHSILHRLRLALELDDLGSGATGEYLLSGLQDTTAWSTLLGWIMVSDLGAVVDAARPQAQSRAWLDEWLFGRRLAATLQELDATADAADYAVSIIKVLTVSNDLLQADAATLAPKLTALFTSRDGQRVLSINEYAGIRYFNQEVFDQLMWWLFVATACSSPTQSALATAYQAATRLKAQAKASGYQVEKFLAGLVPQAVVAPAEL